jgi:hypothetical protein
MEKESIPSEACSIIAILERISERDHCAGWVGGIEHTMWEMLINPEPTPSEDDDLFNWDWPEHEIKLLRKLAASCSGWVRFNPDAKDFYESRVFVPIDEWVPMYAAYTGKEMTEDQRIRFEHFMGLDKKAREELLDRIARIALAIQASGHVNVGYDFIEVLKLIPVELRRCPECGISPGEDHRSGCGRSISEENIKALQRLGALK